MMLLFFGFLVILGQSVVLADLTLFPENHESIYTWTADVSTGIVLPSLLNSSWGFNVTLRVQQVSSNTTAFQIRDAPKTHENTLGLPFIATFIDGSLTGLSVSSSDPVWSVNMKRALLSILQVKLDTALFSPASSGTENGLLGKCHVEYYKMNDRSGSDSMTLRKILDQESCSNYKVEQYSNIPVSPCPGTFKNIVANHIEREYEMTPSSPVLLRKITADGRTLVQPYQAKAESFYSKIHQEINFISLEDIKQPITVINRTSVDLVYQPLQLDPTYGKAPENYSAIVDEVFHMLGELSDSLSGWEVGVKGLDNQTSFYLLDLMSWLRVEDWETLYESVAVGTSYRQETIQHLFWDLVPQVGSQAAVLFIKNLVKSERLKGIMATRLLVNFPFYLKETSEELLISCEDLIKLESPISEEVQQSGVLSFSSLIHKVCHDGKCKADTLDRYAKLYLDKFTGSKSYENQMLWLQGLHNIQLSQVLDFLAPVVAGQTMTDKNIRFLAIWVTLPAVYFSPDKAYDIYWPLLSNRSEPLEIRVASLTLIMMSKPTMSTFFSLYWFMQGEPNEQLYNYYYTTMHSLAGTNYPCYEHLGSVANKIVRFVHPKSRHWATGNYLLDFEDPDRAYGAFMQMLLIASERTGLPNIFMFLVENHSFGHSKLYAIYLKIEGLEAVLVEEFEKLSNEAKAAGARDSRKTIEKVLELLASIKAPINPPETLHLELILKIDDRVVISQYMNSTNFDNWVKVVKRASSLYFEFSVNYQSLNFPHLISFSSPLDVGSALIVQSRSASLVSTRGSISQENEGRARNAELDLRYSWNGVTSLKTYDPLNNKWHGSDRCRNLHIRLPFATQLILQFAKSVVKITAVKHKDFVTGSRLGLVWHASSRLVTNKPVLKMYPNISDEWTMDSEDLGARLGASVFDCGNPDTLPDALHLLKKSFLSNHKNYNMLPSGVILLGILSLRDHLQFQPQGSNCGVMLYFTPLLTQVEPVVMIEGNQLKLSMTREDGLLWEVIAASKRLADGNEEVTFKLYRTPSVSVTVAHIWRVIQLEGAFIVPSRVSGVFHRPPAALTGYTFVSWGDATPSQTDKAAMLDVKVLPGVANHNDSNGLYCEGYTLSCLQAISDAAARQTITLQYANLPGWLKTAAHALFPEHIQAESTRTQVTFGYPMALLPWNTKGLCALNTDSVLTLDNSTLPIHLSPSCYSLAVADCSRNASFAIQVTRIGSNLGARILSGNDLILLSTSDKGGMDAVVNGYKVENIHQTGYQRIDENKLELSVRLRTSGIVEVELSSGVVFQHYNTTAVILLPATFRGFTCGLCGDFNGDTSQEPSHPYDELCTAGGRDALNLLLSTTRPLEPVKLLSSSTSSPLAGSNGHQENRNKS